MDDLVKIGAIFKEAKQFLNFTKKDIIILRKCYPKFEPLFPEIVDIALKRLGTSTHVISILEKHRVPISAARLNFLKWLDSVFTSNYDVDAALKAYKIGEVHDRTGIDSKYVTMTMGIFIMVFDYIFSRNSGKRKALFIMSHTIKKALFLNLTMMLESYEVSKSERHNETVESLKSILYFDPNAEMGHVGE